MRMLVARGVFWVRGRRSGRIVGGDWPSYSSM
jgi:hypothetical protein